MLNIRQHWSHSCPLDQPPKSLVEFFLRYLPPPYFLSHPLFSRELFPVAIALILTITITLVSFLPCLSRTAASNLCLQPLPLPLPLEFPHIPLLSRVNLLAPCSIPLPFSRTRFCSVSFLLVIVFPRRGFKTFGLLSFISVSVIVPL